jgi:hypothetical protein
LQAGAIAPAFSKFYLYKIEINNMTTILNKSECDAIINRINKLTPDAKSIWGKMTVNEMLCHTADLLRDILGIRQTEPVTPVEMRPQIIAMVITAQEWDKNLPTFPPYLQGECGGGTKPANFEADKKTLLDLVNKFCNTTDNFSFFPHAGLGVLSREQNGNLIWKHTDHHLRQFGV